MDGSGVRTDGGKSPESGGNDSGGVFGEADAIAGTIAENEAVVSRPGAC